MPMLSSENPTDKKTRGTVKRRRPQRRRLQVNRNISVDKAVELIQASDNDFSDVRSRDSPDGLISSDEEGDEGRTERVEVEKSCITGTSTF